MIPIKILQFIIDSDDIAMFMDGITRFLLCITSLLHAQASTVHDINVPVHLDFPRHLQFLIPSSQQLIDSHLALIEFPKEINYTITLHDVYIPDSIVINLGFSDQESFYISPVSRTTTIFQTDAIIAHNKMSEFIKDVIVGPLLGSEIDNVQRRYPNNHVSLQVISQDTYKVNIFIRSDRFYEWDHVLFQELFQPVLNELKRFISLDVEVFMELIENHSSQPHGIFIDDLEKEMNPQELFFFVFPSQKDLKIDEKYDEQVIIPQRGGIITHKINGDMHQMDQIEIMELLTGQLFKLLGYDDFKDPTSPFIKIDMLVRRKSFKRFWNAVDCDIHYKIVDQN